jgi:hypothetical protein
MSSSRCINQLEGRDIVADIYPWLKVFGEKDIGWLHISMDDRAAAAILKIIQCFCDT